MNPVMYILVPRDHTMSPGKLGAQTAHAAVEAYRASCKRGPDLSEPANNIFLDRARNQSLFEETSLTNRWRRGGHYAKIVLECDDLLIAKEYIEARGFKTELIIDEGRTEVEALTPTALGVEIVDKDWPHARETFSSFKLHSRPAVIVLETGKITPQGLANVRALINAGDLKGAQELVERNKQYHNVTSLRATDAPKRRWRDALPFSR